MSIPMNLRARRPTGRKPEEFSGAEGVQKSWTNVPSLEIKIALDRGQAPVSRPFDKRLQLEVRPAIKAVPEPVP
jgi:hypothetical protein